MSEKDLYALAQELSNRFTQSKYRSFLVSNDVLSSRVLEEFERDITGIITKSDYIKETLSFIEDWDRFIELLQDAGKLPRTSVEKSVTKAEYVSSEKSVADELIKTTPQKGRIFISYRRVDSEGYAGRIYDRLAPHFGADAIFMDVDDIPAGVDFVKFLENEVQSCDVLIALIGRQWLNVKDEHGKRRLDSPKDFVRIEIATALERDIRVIPVLLGGVGMPKAADLPDSLQPLPRRSGLLVYHHSFHTDTNRLIKHLEDALSEAEKAKKERVDKKREQEAAEQALKEYEEAERYEKEAREAEEELKKERIAEEKRTLKEKMRKEEQMADLLRKANLAIRMGGWQSAKKKLQEVLDIDAEHTEARVSLRFVEKELNEQERIARENQKVEGRREPKKNEQRNNVSVEKTLDDFVKGEKRRLEEMSRISEEKARAEIDKESLDFSTNEKVRMLFLISVGLIALIVVIGLVTRFIGWFETGPLDISDFPTSTSLPTETSAPARTSTPTEISATPTPELGVGSTMVSEEDGMTLVYVPAGEFEMGSENGDDDEMPVHTIYLDAYWIDQTEVSNAQFSFFVEKTNYQTDAEREGESYLFNDGSWYVEKGVNWQYPQGLDSDISKLGDHPVVHVSWNDARAYCEWAGRHLPSEAQWEKAARGDLIQKTYPWGDIAPICKLGAENGAKFHDNANCNDIGTDIVGSYSSNGYGVYDMAGNVWEWCQDWYDSNQGYKVLRGFRCVLGLP